MIPVIAFAIGASLGFFYFGGLWLMVQQLTVSLHPYLLIFLSFILRLGVTLFVVSLILSGNNVYGVIPLLVFCLGVFSLQNDNDFVKSTPQ